MQNGSDIFYCFFCTHLVEGIGFGEVAKELLNGDHSKSKV